MPMTYTIDRDRRQVIFTGHGVLTDADVTERRINRVLRLMRADGSPHSTARIAIVTDGPSVFMARLLTALADAETTARQYRSFEDFNVAQAWLMGDE